MNVEGGAVASLLARSRGGRAVLVRALVRAMMLCSWARHLTLTVALSIQVFKWVPTNLMRGGGGPANGQASHSVGSIKLQKLE